jgi:hypothetical protein
MSTHNRTSRRRRIAFGLGATGGGLLAAAFMPMGIAMADNVGVSTAADAAAAAATGTGNIPFDNEVTPDPFSDFTGFPDAGNAEGLLDQQINIDNPFLAAQLDYDIDNKLPFSFSALDGIPAQTAAFTDADTGGTDTDPFLDAFTNNGGTSTLALPTGETQADAISYDYALNHLLSAGQVGQLDALADSTPGVGVVTGTAPEPTTPDPFLDALQATTANPSADQIAQADQADFLLNLQNPTYAGQLDAAVQAAITNHTLSLTSTAGGGTGDMDAFQDAFTNAGATDALNPGGAFDSTADLSGLSNQLDPIVDTLGNPATLPDLDPVADFVQIFDPHAFATNPMTLAETPTDFLGQLAVFDDTFLQAIGLAAPLDQFVDTFTSGFTTTGTDALTGVLGMFGL